MVASTTIVVKHLDKFIKEFKGILKVISEKFEVKMTVVTGHLEKNESSQ